MNRKKLLWLFLCLSVSTGIVIGIFQISIKANKVFGGFIRHLPPHLIVGLKGLNLKSSTYYFAGFQNNKVILGNYESLNSLLQIDITSLASNQFTLLKGLPRNLTVFKDVYFKIDSPELCLLDGLKARIWFGKSADFSFTDSLSTVHFTAVIPLSANTFILRCNKNGTSNIIAKLKSNGSIFEPAIPILNHRDNDSFSTDGKLLRISGSSKFLYLYYYKNEIICADTNLHVLYRAHTIDTIAHAHVKVAYIHSKHELTLAAPPLFVNKQSCANDKYLFVHSAIQANNETTLMHDSAAAIDVYNTSDGKYLFSFYLPDFQGYKLRDFTVYKTTLMAFFGPYLYMFKLNF